VGEACRPGKVSKFDTVMEEPAYIPLFINAHTHVQIYDAYIELVSLEPGSHERPRYFSMGIHPWRVSGDDLHEKLAELKFVAGAANCLAIGECGLDKLSKADFALQEQAFTEQIKIANELKKPLVVHCVKAFNELLNCLNKADNKMPVVVHGFNNNENIAAMLAREGCYLSFGRALLGFDSNASRAIRHVGRKKFFLETDDADISIKYIYRKAAELLGVGEEILTEQVKANFREVFGINVDKYNRN
jgi:TatD DNase family protein